MIGTVCGVLYMTGNVKIDRHFSIVLVMTQGIVFYENQNKNYEMNNR